MRRVTRRTSLQMCAILIISLCYASATQTIGQIEPTTNNTATSGARHELTTATILNTLDLNEVAASGDELSRLLQDVKRRLANNSERVRVRQELYALTIELETRAQQTDEVLASLPSLADLQDLVTEWTVLRNRLAGMRRTLAANAVSLNEAIAWLNSQQQRWTSTYDQIQVDASLEELRTSIRHSVEDLKATKNLADDELKQNVTLQTRLSERDVLIASVLDKINDEKNLVHMSLFRADSSPLWQFAARRQTDLGLQRVLGKNYQRDWRRLLEYISTNRGGLAVALFALPLVIFCGIKMRRRLPEWLQSGTIDERSAYVFERPYSLALLLVLILSLPFFPTAPTAVKGLFTLLFMLPVIRFLGPIIPLIDRQLFFMLLLPALTVQAIRIGTTSLTLKRNLLAIFSLLSCFVVARMVLRMRRIYVNHAFGRSLVLFGLWTIVVFLFASLIANVVGFFALSQVLTDVSVFGAYYVVVLYVAAEVVSTILSALLKTDTAKRLTAIREHNAFIIRSMNTLIAITAITVGLGSILLLFTVRDDLLNIIRIWLSTPIGSGSANFTGKNIVTFLLVILIGMIGATVARVVLREDVLKRLPLPYGMPFAVSTITYYLLLFFVFILALLLAGVELSKLTLFTGAIGIGLGFGLQTTINNFASSVIILFERPIRERDILEVAGAFGEVTRIGLRSTSIRTYEEAEVIIPNSTLVAANVINWSRLGKRRRVELPVRVVYGADPENVIELLIQTATSHPEVLKDPAPKAFLTRFGDKGLELLLLFWVARYNQYRSVLSEVAVSVNTAFREAGVQVPVLPISLVIEPDVTSRSTPA